LALGQHFGRAELHSLLLALLSTFREKLEWLEEAETVALRLRAGWEPSQAHRKVEIKKVENRN